MRCESRRIKNGDNIFCCLHFFKLGIAALTCTPWHVCGSDTVRHDLPSKSSACVSADCLKQLQDCTTCPGKQELRNEADHYCCNSSKDRSKVQEGFMFRLRFAIAHVHDDNHAQIVVCRDKRCQHADDSKTRKATRDHSSEEIELANQPHGRWKADQRQHKDGHRGGQSGMLASQPRIII